MLALLMCRDTIENKASLFVDTVIGRVNVEQNMTSIQAESLGLKRGIKLLTYFSEVFPKQYQNEFLQYINRNVAPKD